MNTWHIKVGAIARSVFMQSQLLKTAHKKFNINKMAKQCILQALSYS